MEVVGEILLQEIFSLARSFRQGLANFQGGLEHGIDVADHQRAKRPLLDVKHLHHWSGVVVQT
mgnify:CR=1 FL=1